MSVSPQDFQYMTECLTRDIIVILMQERGMTMSQAFDCLYNSSTYQKLENPKTGLFFQSPRYVLSYLDTETKG